MLGVDAVNVAGNANVSGPGMDGGGVGLTPHSQMYAEEHQRHVAYHEREAVEHDAHREPEAVALYRRAAEAHEAAAAAPSDPALSRTAMRASAMAGEVSQGVRRQRRV